MATERNMEQVEHHLELDSRQSQNKAAFGFQVESRLERSQTLRGIELQEKSDSRRSRTLGRAALLGE
jgi:hypothetical protein